MAECEEVGESMADIAGIGILIGFAAQGFLSLVLAAWVFFLSKHGDLEVKHQEGSLERTIESKRLEFVADVLMVGNDIQMLTGIAYMVTAFTFVNTIDLYHLHLMYDTVSFVGVSSAAALVCWSFCAAKLPDVISKFPPRHPTKVQRVSRWTPRHRVTYVFACLFLALTILLEVRLNEWEDADSSEEPKPGRCYYTNGISSPTAGHPWTDKTYVGITAGWLLAVLASAIFGRSERRKLILILAFIQYPVHLYMMIALRTANQDHLSGEEGENGWDFGQTTAILLLGITINELVGKSLGFRKEVKELRREAGGYSSLPDRMMAEEEGKSSMRMGELRETNSEQVPGYMEGQGQGQHNPALQGQ